MPGLTFDPAPDAPAYPRTSEDIVKTEIYESDPFTPRKGRLLAALASEYRFEKGDELFFDDEPSRLKVRIISVQVHIKANGDVYRDILALKL
jgi:hypothetical protein